MGRKMISLTKNNELKGYKSLDVYPEVAHFVTTRHEGIRRTVERAVSSGAYTFVARSYEMSYFGICLQ